MIVGGGFAGINCATRLGGIDGVEVVVVDQRNHHLFQPLLYQVAMAGLSPADIAVPIRTLLSSHSNVRVLQATVTNIHLDEQQIETSAGPFDYDVLVLAAGAQHSYFGNESWRSTPPA